MSSSRVSRPDRVGKFQRRHSWVDTTPLERVCGAKIAVTVRHDEQPIECAPVDLDLHAKLAVSLTPRWDAVVAPTPPRVVGTTEASPPTNPKFVIEGFSFVHEQQMAKQQDMMMQQQQKPSRRSSTGGGQSVHSCSQGSTYSYSYDVADHHSIDLQQQRMLHDRMSSRSVHQMQLEALKFKLSSVYGSDARSYSSSHQSQQAPSVYSRLSARNHHDHVGGVAADEGTSVSHSVSSSQSHRMELVRQRSLVDLKLQRLDQKENFRRKPEALLIVRRTMIRDQHDAVQAPDEPASSSSSEYDSRTRPAPSSGGPGYKRQTSNSHFAPLPQKEEAVLKLIAELEEATTSSTDIDNSLDDSGSIQPNSSDSCSQLRPPSPRRTDVVDPSIVKEQREQIKLLRKQLKRLKAIPKQVNCDADSNASVSIVTDGVSAKSSKLRHVNDLNITVEMPPHSRIGWHTGPAKSGRVPHGDGTIRFSNGDKYAGNFTNGEMHGVAGNYEWSHGDAYCGEFWHNMRHGKGVYMTSNGRRYVGCYQYDKPNGFGVLYNKVRSKTSFGCSLALY